MFWQSAGEEQHLSENLPRPAAHTVGNSYFLSLAPEYKNTCNSFICAEIGIPYDYTV